jgi:hypothetical protein
MTLTPGRILEIQSIDIEMQVDFMRKGRERFKAAIDLVRRSDVVREVLPADAAAIIEEAASIVLSEIESEYRRRGLAPHC